MARPLRIQYPGAYYHVTCRGNERRRIFLDDDDRYRFLRLLAESLGVYDVVLYAYVMMDNHFHLVVQTPRANLSEFMRRFNICYTGWFNYHHATCGHVYQGRYKALLIDADAYLLELSRYVHLNPVRAGKYGALNNHEQMQHVERYKWSSLPGYLDKQKAVDIVAYDMILSMVGSQRGYRRFLLDGLRSGIKDPFRNVQYRTVLGDDDFVSRVTQESISLGKGSPDEQPAYREMARKVIAPDELLTCVAESLGADIERVRARSGLSIERAIVAELLYRYSGITQHKIGQLLGGVGYSAVSMMRRHLKQMTKESASVRKKYAKAEQRVRELIED